MRHPKNHKRSGGKRWQPLPLTGHALEEAVKMKKKLMDREWEEYEKRWYKKCEEGHVHD